MLLSVLAILFVFGVIVIVHEWGHMMAAKSCGVAVPDFALGMGPSLWSFHWRGTRYHICAIPIGGFVRIAGLEGDDALPGTKREREKLKGENLLVDEGSDGSSDEITPPAENWRTWRQLNGWQKAFILVAGPLMNFALALVIIFIMGGIGFPQNAVLVSAVETGSPAEQAGLQAGDLVTQVGGERVGNSRQFAAIVHAYKDRALPLTVVRGGEALNIEARPQVIDGYNKGKVSIGIAMADQSYLTNEVGLIQPKSLADQRIETTGGEKFRLSVGDRITAIDGEPLSNGLDLISRMAEIDENGIVLKPAEHEFTLSVARKDGSEHTFVVPADTSIITLGIQFKPELQKLPVAESFTRSLEDAKIYMIGMVWGMKMLFTKEGAKSISGPVGIVRMIGQSAQSGWHTFLFVFMLINLNLGLINLMPVPALDGGRLVFVALNGLGIRINEKREALVHAMGMVLLFTLIGLVTLTDVLAWL
ncbi:MAG: RIP metalloprotease [bacterium]|nr:RIP metalloprotease [bacterium]